MGFQRIYGDLDPNDNLNEDDFEDEFGLERVTDPYEKARRQKALKENEEIVKNENEDFLNGKKNVVGQD